MLIDHQSRMFHAPHNLSDHQSVIEGNAIFRQGLIYLFQGQSFGRCYVIGVTEVPQDVALRDLLLDRVLPEVDNDRLKSFQEPSLKKRRNISE